MNADAPLAGEAQQIRSKLAAWFAQNGRTLPWRSTPSPYAVMVSEFMLQQTQVVTVIPYFERWMQRFPDVAALARADEQSVLHAWQGLGYYSRARNLQKAAQQIVARYGGVVPSDPAELLTLPGVGRYCAGAIASFAFDKPAAAVDANIARVLARLGNVQTPVDTPAGSREIWDLAEALLPFERGGRLHTSALMELGALLCSPQKPQCLICPVQAHCRAADPAALPRKAPRRATVAVDEHAAWIVHGNALLLEQQTGRRAGGLWKLPVLKCAPEGQPIFESTYAFTHHKVALRVHEIPPPRNPDDNLRWFRMDTVLEEAALTAAHRRALEALLSRKS